MSTELRETLLAARALLYRGWTKGVMARGQHNQPMMSLSNDAVAWCAVGAIRHVCAGDRDKVEQAVNAVWSTGVVSLMEFNDDPETSKEHVLAIFDRAILNPRLGGPKFNAFDDGQEEDK